MNFASLFHSFYCAHKEMFFSLLAMRYIFKEYNTKILNFLLRVPTCLVLFLILNKEGGCWWPQQSHRVFYPKFECNVSLPMVRGPWDCINKSEALSCKEKDRMEWIEGDNET